MRKKIEFVNKKAFFEYEVIEKYEAGIVLTGSEVKAIREGKVNFQDSYCFFRNGELFLRNLHIGAYQHAGFQGHEPTRLRKLLLHKRELRKLFMKTREKGLTLVPLRVYVNPRQLIKVEIGLVKGKRKYDKRQQIRKRDLERETQRRFSIKY